ncbi:MAG: tetratricopeptide repeat protein [Desulfobacteraceae bacterium]|nr:tetratricopeptide repeat protein [Desulfobacteraceae bacterium]
MKKMSTSIGLWIVLWVLSVIPFDVAHGDVDFDAQISELEQRLGKVEGKQKADLLEKLISLYDNRSPKKAIHYCSILLKEYEKLNNHEGMASTFYSFGNYYYYTGFYDKALEVYHQMLVHCEKNKVKVYKGRALVLIGRVHFKRGYYDRAMGYYEKSLKHRTAIGDEWGVFCSLNNIGHVYAGLGDYEKAVKYQFDSLKGYEKIGDKFGIGFSQENIGKAYFTLNNYEKALEFFLKALEAYRETEDFWFEGMVYQNIGNCYRMVGESKKAFENYSRSIRTAEQKNLGWVLPWARALTGSVYNDLGRHQKAIEMNQKALARFEEFQDLKGIYEVYKNFAVSYIEMDQLDKAHFYLKKRYARSLSHDDRMVVIDSLNMLGSVYTRLGEYEKAIQSLLQAHELSNKVQATDLLIDNARAMSQLYAAQGDHKKSLDYFKTYRNLETQSSSRTMNGKLVELQKAYEQDKERLEKKVTGLYLVFAALAAGLVIFSLFRGFRHYQNELVLKGEKIRSLQVESKLKLFQARINPHFLFNSLDAVIQLGQENDPDKLKETVLKLSNVYRNILAMPDLPEVELSQELQVVEDYLEIEKEISNGKIDFCINVADDLKAVNIIPLCILTLVENAVKHGVSKKKDGGRIDIVIEEAEDRLEVEVKDTGAGFSLEDMDDGFGLYSVQKRLELYYQGKASFNILSEKGSGTTALMEIPYVKS